MTDDLVKRLRAIDKDIILRRFDPEMSFDGMTAHEAASRIEKLEAALREIADGQRDADKSYAELFAEVRIEARKALEGKDDPQTDL